MSAAAACLITAGGTSIAELHAYVREVTVELKRGDSSTATIVFDAFRDERGRWSVQDSGRMTPWEDVVISAIFDPADRQEVVHVDFVRDVDVAVIDHVSANEVDHDLPRRRRSGQHHYTEYPQGN